jgi:hypothetical protein
MGLAAFFFVGGFTEGCVGAPRAVAVALALALALAMALVLAVAEATTVFAWVTSFWGPTFVVVRFFVFCCSFVKLLAPRAGCWVAAGALAPREDVVVGETLLPVVFFVPLRAVTGFSVLVAVEVVVVVVEGLGVGFFGRRITRVFALRAVIVEMVGTCAERFEYNTSTLGRGLDLSFPERIILRKGAERSKKRAWSSSFFEWSSFCSWETKTLSMSANCCADSNSFKTASTSRICRTMFWQYTELKTLRVAQPLTPANINKSWSLAIEIRDMKGATIGATAMGSSIELLTAFGS